MPIDFWLSSKNQFKLLIYRHRQTQIGFSRKTLNTTGYNILARLYEQIMAYAGLMKMVVIYMMEAR